MLESPVEQIIPQFSAGGKGRGRRGHNYAVASLPLHVDKYLPPHGPDTTPASPGIARTLTVSANTHLHAHVNQTDRFIQPGK